MKHSVIYIHGKGGSASEAEHYARLFPEANIIGFDYKSQTPWEAAVEFPVFFGEQTVGAGPVTLIANSIGAYFSMISLSKAMIDRAFFISPIVNMEKLITDMMKWANISEDELRCRRLIPTDFGETLSWDYLCYVRSHPVKWNIPTRILYGRHDSLTTYETISGFAKRTGAALTVMEDGEHWFHTDEQMKFLDSWIGDTIPSE